MAGFSSFFRGSPALVPLNIASPTDESPFDDTDFFEEGEVFAVRGPRRRPWLSQYGRYGLFVLLGLGFLLFCSFFFSFGGHGYESWGPGMTIVNATAAIDKSGVTWVESTVSVNGITVDYYKSVPTSETAEGKPLPKLVFFHGGGSSGAEGIQIFESFTDRFEVICPSARGFGRTTRAPPFGTAQMVKDAVALLPLLSSPGEKFSLVAHSMGATVAPRVAKEHPELVAALVLEDPGWLRREGEDPSKNRPGYSPRGGDDLSNESVEGIQVPTLILTAEHGDGVPEVIDAALSTYPQGNKHYFPGAGHCIHCDAQNGYPSVVKSYLVGKTSSP